MPAFVEEIFKNYVALSSRIIWLLSSPDFRARIEECAEENTERGRLCDGGCKVLHFQEDRPWGWSAKRVPWAD